MENYSNYNRLKKKLNEFVAENETFVETLSHKQVKNGIWYSIVCPNEEKFYYICLNTWMSSVNKLVLKVDGVYARGLYNFGRTSNKIIGVNECQFTYFELDAFNVNKVRMISRDSYLSMALTENDRINNCKRNQCSQMEIGNEDDGDVCCCDLNECGKSVIANQMIISTPIKLNRSRKLVEIASHTHDEIPAENSSNSITHIRGKIEKEMINETKDIDINSFDGNIQRFVQKWSEIYESVERKFLKFDKISTKTDKFETHFIDKRRIGGGSYGEVFKVRKKSNKKYYAIKSLRFTKKYENEFMKELESSITFKLKNEKVVKYFDVWLERDLFENLKLYIQMELCDESLAVIIDEIKNNSNLCFNETLSFLGFYIGSQIFIEILDGVNYLHKQSPPVIHRNLNPWNILLKIEEQNINFVKIADIGLMTINEYAIHSQTQDLQHYNYIAPEVERNTEYDTRADIYSLGTVLQKLFFIDLNRDYKIHNESQPNLLLMSKYLEISSLCDRMTRRRANQRPANIEEILEETNLWALDVNEFNYIEELGKISNDNDQSFVFQLLKKYYNF